MIKEIIVFSYGDPRKAKTWSNVPACFIREAERRNIKTFSVNINPHRLIASVYNRIIYPYFINIVNPGSLVRFEKTRLFKYLTYKIIKRSLKKHPHADLSIFFCYDFYNKYDNRPTILFHDWTGDILIRQQLCRNPYFEEKRFLNQQKEAILHSDFVITLFQNYKKLMDKKYGPGKITFLGGNVINSYLVKEPSEEEIIHKKLQRRNLLFIGGEKYLSSARLLIEANHLLHDQYEVHIIGLKEEDVKYTNPHIHYYGYLDKDNPNQCETYYRLLLSCSIFVNVTPKWAGYSSTIEAMYYFTPIIVYPYKSFVDEFGEQIDFGVYNQKFDAKELANNINEVMTDENFAKLCRNSRQKVKSYSWSSYFDRFLKKVESVVD